MRKVLRFLFRNSDPGAPRQAVARHAPEIDLSARDVRVGGQVRRIEPRAAKVLSQLIAARGAVVDRNQLLDAGWGAAGGSDEGLSQIVGQLRKALGDDARSPSFIATVPKAGYRWLGPVGGFAREGGSGTRTANNLNGGPAWPWVGFAGAVLLGGVAGGLVHFALHVPVAKAGRFEIETVEHERRSDGRIFTHLVRRRSNAHPPEAGAFAADTPAH